MNIKKLTSKSALVTLFLVVATELVGFGLIIPVLPQIATRFQSSGLAIGFLLASYSIAQFFSTPILGSLSDRYGRKPLLIVSKIGSCLAYVLFAFAPSFKWLLISRLVDGVTGGNISIARAYVSDVTEPENRSKGMAVIGIAFASGLIFGPAVGGLLYGHGHGYVYPGLFAAGCSFVALLLTIFILKEPERRLPSTSPIKNLMSTYGLLADKSLLLICGVQVVSMVVFSGFETTFSVFMQQYFGFSEKMNSWMFFYVGLLILLFQGGMSRRSFSKFPRLIVTGMLIMAVGYFFLSMTKTLLWMLGASLFIAGGLSLLNVCLPAYLSLKTDPETKGGAMGLFEAFGSLSRILGPMVAYSTIYGSLRMGYFGFSVILILGAFGFLVFSYRRETKSA